MKITFVYKVLPFLCCFLLANFLTNYITTPTIYSHEKAALPVARAVQQIERHNYESSSLAQTLLYNIETPSREFSDKYYNYANNTIVLVVDLYDKKGNHAYRYKYLIKSINGILELEINKIKIQQRSEGKIHEYRILATLYDKNMNGTIDGDSLIYDWSGNICKMYSFNESGGVEFQQEFDAAISMLPKPAV